MQHIAVFETGIVFGVEPGVLGVGHFQRTHPEALFYSGSAAREFIAETGCASHHELSGRDPYHIEFDSLAEIDAHLVFLQGILHFRGLFGRERPTLCDNVARRRRGSRGRDDRGDLLRQNGEFLGVLVDARVEFQHGAATISLIENPLFADDLPPGPMCRRVQVDPRHDAVPRLGVELYVIVPLVEHLHQRGRRGVHLVRLEHVHVALHCHGPHEAAQHHVRRREVRRVIVTAVPALGMHRRAGR